MGRLSMAPVFGAEDLILDIVGGRDSTSGAAIHIAAEPIGGFRHTPEMSPDEEGCDRTGERTFKSRRFDSAAQCLCRQGLKSGGFCSLPADVPGLEGKNKPSRQLDEADRFLLKHGVNIKEFQ